MHIEHNYFKDFPNKFFIETGSYRGDGMQLALDAGFENIISIENSKEQYDFVVNRFDMQNNFVYDNYSNVKHFQILHSESAEGLNVILNTMWNRIIIDAPCTFWLDAHSQGLDHEPKSLSPYPLFDELEAIAKHHIKTHTILIDDIMHLTHPDITGWNRKMIESKVKEINPNYIIEYRSNPRIDDILIAHL